MVSNPAISRARGTRLSISTCSSSVCASAPCTPSPSSVVTPIAPVKLPSDPPPVPLLPGMRLLLLVATLLVLLGFAFVALIACETLRGRSFGGRRG